MHTRHDGDLELWETTGRPLLAADSGGRAVMDAKLVAVEEAAGNREAGEAEAGEAESVEGAIEGAVEEVVG